MINKYITATFLAVASIGNISSQNVRPVPKLVVNIAIDQLRTDYIEAFIPYYSEGGIKKLLRNGAVYSNAQYMFSPVDRASSIASISTGTSPSSNGITGFRWLNKNTLIPVNCVDDNSYEGIFTKEGASPKNIITTTINDELKIQCHRPQQTSDPGFHRSTIFSMYIFRISMAFSLCPPCGTIRSAIRLAGSMNSRCMGFSTRT